MRGSHTGRAGAVGLSILLLATLLACKGGDKKKSEQAAAEPLSQCALAIACCQRVLKKTANGVTAACMNMVGQPEAACKAAYDQYKTQAQAAGVTCE